MTPPLFPGTGGAAPGPAREQRALIALTLVPGVGPGRARALVSRFGSAMAAMTARTPALETVPGIGAQTAQAITSFRDRSAVDEQIARAGRVDAAMAVPGDGVFPRLLEQIYDPPAFLWVRGTLLEQDERAIAIVGTRRPTEYGRRVAGELATGLAQAGFTIVSGLAYGIDAVAHHAALNAGGRTIAVLGSGVDRIYPPRNAALAREIVARGAVVSEYAMGAAPDAQNFPRRNRIVSGLALGVLVVEAYETGGALITARLAVEQNREVFAVPSAIHSKAGCGANQLIQRGHAKLVASVADILEELGMLEHLVEAVVPAEPPPVQDGPERQLFDALGSDPVHIDALCGRTGLDSSTALVHLLSLEFKGLVRQMAGKQFFRSWP